MASPIRRREHSLERTCLIVPLRVFIDTNVLVSAILFGGTPGQVVDAARDGQVAGIVSLHVLAETRDVLTRPRFGFERETADIFAEEIAAFCEIVPLERADSRWSSDPDDDPVVEAALFARADAVVTGDAELLALRVRGLRFLTPADALDLISRE